MTRWDLKELKRISEGLDSTLRQVNRIKDDLDDICTEIKQAMEDIDDIVDSYEGEGDEEGGDTPTTA